MIPICLASNCHFPDPPPEDYQNSKNMIAAIQSISIINNKRLVQQDSNATLSDDVSVSEVDSERRAIKIEQASIAFLEIEDCAFATICRNKNIRYSSHGYAMVLRSMTPTLLRFQVVFPCATKVPIIAREIEIKEASVMFLEIEDCAFATICRNKNIRYSNHGHVMVLRSTTSAPPLFQVIFPCATKAAKVAIILREIAIKEASVVFLEMEDSVFATTCQDKNIRYSDHGYVMVLRSMTPILPSFPVTLPFTAKAAKVPIGAIAREIEIKQASFVFLEMEDTAFTTTRRDKNINYSDNYAFVLRSFVAPLSDIQIMTNPKESESKMFAVITSNEETERLPGQDSTDTLHEDAPIPQIDTKAREIAMKKASDAFFQTEDILFTTICYDKNNHFSESSYDLVLRSVVASLIQLQTTPHALTKFANVPMCPIKRVACIKKPSIKEYWPTFQEVFGSGVTCWSDDTTPMDYEALPRLIAAQSKQPTATKPIRSPTPEPLSTKHILPTTSKPKTKKGRKHNRRK